MIYAEYQVQQQSTAVFYTYVLYVPCTCFQTNDFVSALQSVGNGRIGLIVYEQQILGRGKVFSFVPFWGEGNTARISTQRPYLPVEQQQNMPCRQRHSIVIIAETNTNSTKMLHADDATLCMLCVICVYDVCLCYVVVRMYNMYQVCMLCIVVETRKKKCCTINSLYAVSVYTC